VLQHCSTLKIENQSLVDMLVNSPVTKKEGITTKAQLKINSSTYYS